MYTHPGREQQCPEQTQLVLWTFRSCGGWAPRVDPQYEHARLYGGFQVCSGGNDFADSGPGSVPVHLRHSCHGEFVKIWVNVSTIYSIFCGFDQQYLCMHLPSLMYYVVAGTVSVLEVVSFSILRYHWLPQRS